MSQRDGQWARPTETWTWHGRDPGGSAELTEKVRQDHDWERTALAELRHGSVSRAVAMYNRRGKINLGATDDDTIDQAVGAWYRDVHEIGDPAQVLFIGHRNATVHELNRRARSLIAEAGLLEGPTLTAHGRDYQTGGRVVRLKNRTRLGVLNGDLATVTGVDTDRRTITIRLDREDRLARVPHWYLDDGHLDWGLRPHRPQSPRSHRTAVDRLAWVIAERDLGRGLRQLQGDSMDLASASAGRALS